MSITCHTQVSRSAHEEACEGQLTGVVPNVILRHLLDRESVSGLQYTWPPLPLTALLLTQKRESEREISQSSIKRTMTARRQTHSTLYLVPRYLWLLARLDEVLDIRAGNVLALAQLGLLRVAQFGVITGRRVIISHQQSHGHLHAERRVPVTATEKHTSHSTTDCSTFERSHCTNT